MITLNGKEIKDLAESVGLVVKDLDYTDEFETEMTIIPCPEVGVANDDGEVEHYRFVAYLDEYPEEGVNPLGAKIDHTV